MVEPQYLDDAIGLAREVVRQLEIETDLDGTFLLNARFGDDLGFDSFGYVEALCYLDAYACDRGAALDSLEDVPIFERLGDMIRYYLSMCNPRGTQCS